MARGTIRDLLEAQSDAKLQRMLAAIAQEFERLDLEQRMIQEVLQDRQRQQRQLEPRASRPQTNAGQFRGMSRDELLAHIVEVGRPVKPAEMARILADKGIEKNEAAIRTSMVRLEKSGKLYRTVEGWAARGSITNGAAKVEAGMQSNLESGQV